MEEYFQETGRAGRHGAPSVATMYYNNFDIRSGKHQVDEVMCEFATSNSCKRNNFKLLWSQLEKAIRFS